MIEWQGPSARLCSKDGRTTLVPRFCCLLRLPSIIYFFSELFLHRVALAAQQLSVTYGTSSCVICGIVIFVLLIIVRRSNVWHVFLRNLWYCYFCIVNNSSSESESESSWLRHWLACPSHFELQSPGCEKVKWLRPRESPVCQKLKWLCPCESPRTRSWND